jgi:hypothetical protein
MKKYSIEIKWSLIFVVMMLVWMFLEKISGLHDVHIDKHPIVTNFISIPAVAIYVLAFMEKKKVFYSGSMNFREGFKCGLVMTIIITIISPLVQIIVSNFITPDYFQNAIQYSINAGYLNQTQAEDYFNLKNYIIQGAMGSFVMGIVTSAIVAFFVRSKKESVSEN